MKNRNQILLENKIRKMVREEMMTESYIQTELEKIEPSAGEPISIKITQGGKGTKFLQLNKESIPKIIKFLKYVNEKFKHSGADYGAPNIGM